MRRLNMVSDHSAPVCTFKRRLLVHAEASWRPASHSSLVYVRGREGPPLPLSQSRPRYAPMEARTAMFWTRTAVSSLCIVLP